MISNYYQLYLEKVFQLAETIVIKSSDSAKALNQYVRDWHGGANAVDEHSPETWKYYMNIAGEYHPTDKLMEVTSIDTLEKISFTKENLRIHRATAREYRYGSRYYEELVATYPDQEQLILGVLYPVDKAKAIQAEDGTILTYPSHLVEENEYSLISKLEAWVKGYKIRWHNKAFGTIHTLYPAYHHAFMYLNLVPAIISIRKAACKTNEAHSFHVTQYLASHGRLDRYMNKLTTKQALWLYRNIRYIDRNAGSQDTFEWLIENVMTARTLPVAEYTMRHNLEKQPDEPYPDLKFKRAPLNLGYNMDARDHVTLNEFLDKEGPLAPGNIEYQADETPAIKSMLENSISNVVLTKALESNMVDRTDATPYTLTDILMNHWMALASNGLYKAVVSVSNPKTGERMPMTAREAFITMFYSFCKAIGIELSQIPNVIAKRVQRRPVPTRNELLSIVEAKYIDLEELDELIANQPLYDSVVSTEAFYNLCVRIYEAAQKQRGLISAKENYKARGYYHAIVSRFYSDQVCVLEQTDTSYGAWFSERNFQVMDLTENEHALLYLELVREATGISLTTTDSLKELQAAMVSLISQLSSYSVQFMSYINSSAIKVIDWPMIRIGDSVGKVYDYKPLVDYVVGVMKTKGRSKQKSKFVLSKHGPQIAVFGAAKDRASIELNVRASRRGSGSRQTVRVWSAPVYFMPEARTIGDLDEITTVPGLQGFNYMSAEERATMLDIYNATGG